MNQKDRAARSIFASRLRWWEWLLLVAALGLFATQDLLASPMKSAAFDEQYHLTAGYSYLRTGDARLATTHPPLMGLLGGLALLGKTVTLPLDNPAWVASDRFLFSDLFLWEANPDPQALLVAARQPIILVGLLLLTGLFFFARQLIGGRASWLVLLLATFDPNLLANARVVTTDLGLACFLLLALWRLWCWLENRSFGNLILTGLCAGLAMSAKYTGLFFWPSAFFITWLYPTTDQVKSTRQDNLWRRWLGLAAIGLVAWGILWIVYDFTFGLIPDLNLPVPVPAPFYWQQLINTYFRIVDMQGARYDFFWGEASNQGWWDYFPVALAVKTPLPLLLLFGAGLFTVARQQRWRRTSVLWVLPLIFLALGLTGILTIGYRHILPAIPCMILLAGYTATPPKPFLRQEVSPSATIRRWLPTTSISLLALWLVVGSLRIWPHQEAFFNELAGDWYNWSNILVDSNLDWGQDLPALRQTMEQLEISEVNLAYFGKAVPERYGVRYRPLPSYLRFVDGIELNAYNPYQPEPGWYAISASELRLGLFQPENVNLYAYFRTLRPIARAGYSIYLYQVTYPATLPVKRMAIFGEPIMQLSPEKVGAPPTGQPPQQRVQVKWLKSPATALYPLGKDFSPPATGNYQVVDANYSDVFTLLGYTQQPAQAQPGQAVQITLYWQVGNQLMPMPAPTRGSPLSAFVHVIDGDPTKVVTQYDGWETALRGLEPGDVIVHQATLDISDQVKPGHYDILIGLYSPQNGARLLVKSTAEQADSVKVGTLEIK
ncbi:MAG: glycosyltransferase family 39 protein [Chloroflexi bacterium]|nr:glycosyltransferase family 39 protein [Chloroflexota bacterium]